MKEEGPGRRSLDKHVASSLLLCALSLSLIFCTMCTNCVRTDGSAIIRPSATVPRPVVKT